MVTIPTAGRLAWDSDDHTDGIPGLGKMECMDETSDRLSSLSLEIETICQSWNYSVHIFLFLFSAMHS